MAAERLLSTEVTHIRQICQEIDHRAQQLHREYHEKLVFLNYAQRICLNRLLYIENQLRILESQNWGIPPDNPSEPKHKQEWPADRGT
ncbi:hypothetical protein LOZ66_006881 [Ophidiomyces ophidiicola]|nr:hypothetical protein LOZ66_006881 [Ophidiomyces ophidiicola]